MKQTASDQQSPINPHTYPREGEGIKPKGFTLLETVIVIAIFPLLIFAVSEFIIQGYRTESFGREQNAAIVSARKGIETMVKEIRELTLGEDGGYPLVKAADQEFIFYSDIDTDSTIEKVRYFVAGTDFKKEVFKAQGNPPKYPVLPTKTEILSEYVRNGSAPIFFFYNGAYPADQVNNPLPTPSRLRETKLMKVSLKINVDLNRAPINFLLESMVQLRNLKENL